ncbi:MAG: acyl-CoA dehydrogenase family protein [Bacteroidales bacterium]|nr:acyl-CoA dehydrogenase family protein [Bacteroidales bacterium]MDE7101399.1 acyl-CoA dehydrogenase family protein [Bacteroidales bacterium]
MNFYSDNEALKFHLNHPQMKKCVDLRENNYADKDKFDYAPENFEDAMDSYDKVMEIIGDISANVLDKNAEEVDHEGPQVIDGRVKYARGTQENHDVLTQAGVYGIALPRKYNGLNFSTVPYVMAAEIVSRGDAGFANIWGLQDCAETICEFATEEIKQEFLPRIHEGKTCSMDLTEPDAGSDLQAVQLKATYDEAKGMWMLNGVKRFITNGDADIKLVLARSEEGTRDGRGLSYFVHDRAWGGVRVRRIENKLGIKGSPTCELVFTNAPARLVGERKLGLIKYVMSLMNGARLGVGAQSVGLSEAAYRTALKYAGEREQFGKAIIEFPAVYELLAVMKAKLDAARSVLYETSRAVDLSKTYAAMVNEGVKLTPEQRAEMKLYQRNADMLTPILKMFSSEYANQIAYDAIQIHGGTGFMKDFPVERMYRDARILTIYEGTSQLQVVAAIRHVLNGNASKLIESYEQEEVKAELKPLREILKRMHAELDKAVETVKGMGNDELVDFHARRLVEIAGYTILGNLVLLDANRSEAFRKSAEVFVAYGEGMVQRHASFIAAFKPESVEFYK